MTNQRGLLTVTPTNVTNTNATPNDPAEAVFATVAYADVFDMPIERRHLERFLVGTSLDGAQLDATLIDLTESGRLVTDGDLTYLPGRDEVIDVHADRTDRAATMWRQAEVWGRRIGHVPFVEMVAVTGGLAVDSVAPHDDIDFFIITRPGRLWLTRLMIIVLGRVAARSDIELCPNYIVATTALDMTPESVYVARELAQMVPMVGPDLCRDLRKRNDWMFSFLPNATVDGDMSRVQPGLSTGAQRLRGLAERVLALAPFARLERWEMERKIRKLTTVSSRRPEVGTPDESSFSPEVCKGHVVGNAAPIDAAWQKRIAAGVDR